MGNENMYIEFFHKVKHVRSLQKQYFATKSAAILISSKTEERALDMMLLTLGHKLEARKKVRA